MSSLIGSIFGDNSKSKNEVGGEDGKIDLFQNSVTLPARPQHKPIERRAKKRNEGNIDPDANNDGEEQEEVGSKKKKRKKDRKKKKEDDDNKNNEDTNNKTDENQSKDNNKNEDDDNDKDNDVDERTIFVGNLPLATTTRKSLAKLFKECGPIVSTRLRSVPVKGIKLPSERSGDTNLMKKVCANVGEVDYDTLKQTVQGYVVFKNLDSVTKAIQLKNNTIIENGSSSKLRLRVDKATPTIEPARSVFVGNLPYSTDEITLQNHFINGCDLQPSDVEGVRIIRDKTTFQCKGFGYVLFKTKSMVAIALKLHDSIYKKKQIRVKVCGKRFKGRKGEPKEYSKSDNITKKSKRKDRSGGDNNTTTPTTATSVGAVRRILAKQSMEAMNVNKRKRGDKKKHNTKSDSAIPHKKNKSGLSKRASKEKKTELRVKKIQKRISKGMGKKNKKS